jgi:DNA processing protein
VHTERRARLYAWLALQALGALRPTAARTALEQAGGDPAGALRRLVARTPGADLSGVRIEDAFRRLRKADVRLIPLGAPAYPPPLATLADPPPLLGVRGDPARLVGPRVAIVGARRPTPYGVGVARRLARELAGLGFGVVSGLALGIDAAAHRGALEAGGVTVGVLGCGPDLVYPSEHQALAADLLVAGALLSELPPGARPLRYHFPLRNRLISGLCQAVIVVEAKARSGSLITAEHAAEQGREVLAVPGPIDASTSEGPNLLLRNGATPVLDASDVLRALGRADEAEAWLRRRSRGAETLVALPPEARAVVDALRRAPVTRDDLATQLGLTPAQLAGPLLALELEGLVAEDRAGRLRIVPR